MSIGTNELERPSTKSEHMDDVCAGCIELSERIERLEKLVGSLAEPMPNVTLSTTMCYWICVVVHCMFIAMLAMSGILMTIAVPVAIGSCGTLVVCHALAIRPWRQRTARLLSPVLAMLALVTGGYGLIDASAMQTILSYSLALLPLVFFCCWLPAKTLLWVKAWQIKVPGIDAAAQKMKIRDLLVLTFLSALVFGILRIAGVSLDALDNSSETFIWLGYLAIPSVLTGLYSTLLARAILRPAVSANISMVLTIVGAAVVSTPVIYVLLILLAQGETGDEIMLAAIYGVLGTLFALASPIFTFIMMRAAGYRMQLRGKIATSQSPIIAEGSTR